MCVKETKSACEDCIYFAYSPKKKHNTTHPIYGEIFTGDCIKNKHRTYSYLGINCQNHMKMSCKCFGDILTMACERPTDLTRRLVLERLGPTIINIGRIMRVNRGENNKLYPIIMVHVDQSFGEDSGNFPGIVETQIEHLILIPPFDSVVNKTENKLVEDFTVEALLTKISQLPNRKKQGQAV